MNIYAIDETLRPPIVIRTHNIIKIVIRDLRQSKQEQLLYDCVSFPPLEILHCIIEPLDGAILQTD